MHRLDFMCSCAGRFEHTGRPTWLMHMKVGWFLPSKCAAV